ncbi:putative kinase [Haloactinopolyspora alba]|uniref:Putative kinase n=1 Tax=Haloactinopolyspora alba TaxID=648780 RepID=A0A2P8DWL9_9ACTN|nr:putative kinase [Haloactinopolyspora alba]
MLIVVGGLPAAGKSSVARTLAPRLRAAYVRIDSIEVAIDRAEGRSRETNGWDAPPGYAVGYAVAADQLRTGLDVVAESVNPLRASRDAWRDAGLAAGADVLEVEVVCSDTDEHRRRAEERVSDLEGLALPRWEQIVNREYERWDRDRIVVDTAVLGVDEAVRLLLHAHHQQQCQDGEYPEEQPDRL